MPPYDTKEHLDEILEQYRTGMLGLVDLVKRGCSAAGRKCVVVGKANHNPSFEKESLEVELLLAMRKVLQVTFDGSNDMYMYDWYGVAEDAMQKGEWDMVDFIHQGSKASRLETEAFELWSRETLPAGFAVDLGGGGGGGGGV